jgi:hypothetical protein
MRQSKKGSKRKSLPKLKKEAKDLYALWCKLSWMDSNGNVPCYTCDAKMELGTSNCQWGHFWPQGGYSGLIFHPDNSRPQCYRCNIHLKGNFGEFRIRLINEIGQDAVDELESIRHKPLDMTRSDYEEMINDLKDKINQLKQE